MSQPKWYTWGVDGFGYRHYVCRHCEMYFGKVDIDKIHHDCNKSKPKSHNRGAIYDSISTSKRGRAKKPVASVRDDGTEPTNTG